MRTSLLTGLLLQIFLPESVKKRLPGRKLFGEDDPETNFSDEAHGHLLLLQKNWHPENERATALLQQAVDASARGDRAAALRILLQMWRERGARQGIWFAGFHPVLIIIAQSFFADVEDDVAYVNFFEEVADWLDHMRLMASVQREKELVDSLQSYEFKWRARSAVMCLEGAEEVRNPQRAKKLLEPVRDHVLNVMERVRTQGLDALEGEPLLLAELCQSKSFHCLVPKAHFRHEVASFVTVAWPSSCVGRALP